MLCCCAGGGRLGRSTKYCRYYVGGSGVERLRLDAPSAHIRAYSSGKFRDLGDLSPRPCCNDTGRGAFK